MDKKELAQLKRDLTLHKKILKNIGNERENLKYLKITGNEIISTDSFRIVKTPNRLIVRAGFIHLDNIDAIKKNPDEAKKYRVKNVEYPDIKKVIPQFSSYLKIESDDLKRACKIAGGYWRERDKINRQDPMIKLKLKNKSLTIFIKEEMIKTKIKIPVISATRKYLSLLLNPMLLFDIIPISGVITIKINRGDEPIAFGNNIIMPIKKS